MGPSLQIAKILGIPIKLHWTFILMFPLGLYLMEMPGFGIDNLIFFSILFFLISVCVIFHEYGHALAAKYYGIKTDDIILSPLFGVARIQKLPENPLGEFIVAIAGPAVNVLLGLIFLIYLQIINPEFLSVFSYELYHSFFNDGKRINNLPEDFTKVNLTIAILIFVNLGLVVFNLIPAFPMDGGRMFRAFLHNFMDKLAATRIATFLGKAISFIIFLLSVIYGQYGMALIAVFIYYMAASEFTVVKGEFFRNQFSIGDMMKTCFTRLDLFSTKSEVSYLFFNSLEKHFLLFNADNKLEGILLKENIIKWISKDSHSFENEIKNYLITDFSYLKTDSNIDDALEIMRNFKITFLPIIGDEEEIVGVISRRDIYEFIEIQSKIKNWKN